MTQPGMIDYLCYIPYDFNDPTFKEFDTQVLDHGMGVDSEHIFQFALDVLLEINTIDKIVDYLDRILFPVHVPNECATPCIKLCVNYITHMMSSLYEYKKQLNLIVSSPTRVVINKNWSTIEVRFSA